MDKVKKYTLIDNETKRESHYTELQFKWAFRVAAIIGFIAGYIFSKL